MHIFLFVHQNIPHSSLIPIQGSWAAEKVESITQCSRRRQEEDIKNEREGFPFGGVCLHSS